MDSKMPLVIPILSTYLSPSWASLMAASLTFATTSDLNPHALASRLTTASPCLSWFTETPYLSLQLMKDPTSLSDQLTNTLPELTPHCTSFLYLLL